ncbi:MAG TPA: molybdopterin-synthase adenylyltransferase MoeB [Myxococcota bacterium]|nr:molybdopterin-synthase adenylyltransferase MoeB [Myxococcota bacterium]
MSGLGPEQRERYKRHLLLDGVGPEGQTALLSSSVLLIGAGGLGSPAALYLAAAGVGRIGIVDFDRVDASNLQRQILYASEDVGAPKTEVAARKLRALNPDVEVRLHEVKLDASNASEIFAGYDVVLDGTDTFPSRYLASDVCVWQQKPLVSGSVMRFEGQVAVFDARRGPCYRCLFPEPPPPELAPNCAEAGVLGVLPGVIGVLQATEVLKLLLGAGEALVGRLLVYDALAMEFKTFRIPKDPACAVCGEQPTITAPIDYAAFCAAGASEAREPEIAPRELRARLDAGADLLLLDVREPFEAEIASISGARLVPLGQLEARLVELEPWRSRDVVVHCRTGGRSRRACELLRSKGFEHVSNLAGGIEAWALEVDPGMKRY